MDTTYSIDIWFIISSTPSGSSLWVLDCRLNKGNNLKMWLQVLDVVMSIFYFISSIGSYWRSESLKSRHKSFHSSFKMFHNFLQQLLGVKKQQDIEHLLGTIFSGGLIPPGAPVSIYGDRMLWETESRWIQCLCPLLVWVWPSSFISFIHWLILFDSSFMCEGQEVKPAQSRCSWTENWFCSFLCSVQQVADESQLSRRESSSPPAPLSSPLHREQTAVLTVSTDQQQNDISWASFTIFITRAEAPPLPVHLIGLIWSNLFW